MMINFAKIVLLAVCAALFSNHASAQCTPAAADGTWYTGTVGFRGDHDSYYFAGVTVGQRCVQRRVCELNDRGKPVCSYENYGYPTLSILETYPSLFGDAPSFWNREAVDSKQGGNGWVYADTTVYNSYTRTWFRANGAAPEVVFETWVKGVYQGAKWFNPTRR